MSDTSEFFEEISGYNSTQDGNIFAGKNFKKELSRKPLQIRQAKALLFAIVYF
jgi:hypothetical protein